MGIDLKIKLNFVFFSGYGFVTKWGLWFWC